MSEGNPTEEKSTFTELPMSIPKEVEEVLELVPENNRAKAAGLIVTITKSMSYRGNIPHPDIIAGYEHILPGSARELLDMVKEQSAHRMYLEKKAITSQLDQSKLGQILLLL